MSATVHFESSSELARISNTFSVADVATDPTTISLVITDPTQTSTTYTYAASQITKVSTGVYRKDIPCSIDGTWTYEWTGTGAASDDAAGTWEVFPTDLGKLYATVEALKSRLNITTTNHDFEVHEACFAASRAVEQICQRVFYRSGSVARKFIACDLYRLKFADTDAWTGDLVSASAVKTDAGGDGTFETTWSSTDYELNPVNASAGPEARPYTSLEAIGSYTLPILTGRGSSRYGVEVTGVWGWPSVPLAVKQAALILAAELFKLKDAPFGVVEFGELGLIRARENPKVMSLLGPYKRHFVLVG